MAARPLAGKTAVVTGASGSIGYEVAKRFAKEGASVVLAGRTRLKLEKALKNLQEKAREPVLLSQTHGIHTLDVSQLREWQLLTDRHRNIDILVHCAGLSQQSLLARTNGETIQTLLSVNLCSTIFGSREVARQMTARKAGGCIISISSLLAYRAAIGTSIYAAAKAGQLGFTTALSQELAQYGIRVNAVVPGYIDTNMTEGLTNVTELRKRIPVQRFGYPSEVADAVAFLANNGYANNCILNLDGGLSAI